MARGSKKKRKRKAPKDKSNSDVRGGSVNLFDNPSSRLDRAQELWKQGQREQSLRHYDEAIRREPENIRAYVMAARAYAQVYRLDRMEEIFDRLLRRAAKHPGVHHYIGETYAKVKLPDKAVAAYEQAAALPGALPGTWMELASSYERSHRLEEAWELIERTEQAGFDLPLVWLVKARLQRRLKEHDKAEATLRDLISKQPKESDWACQAWGDIALMRDRAGDYSGAIVAIEHCKNSQKARAEQFNRSAKRAQNRLRDLTDLVTREDLLKWREQTKDCPDAGAALLTGFPRSGTTLLEQVLDAHPRLVSSEERDYLGSTVFRSVLGDRAAEGKIYDRLNGLTLSRVRYERDQYFVVMERLLGEPIGSRMHLDKNPAYNLTIPLFLRIFPETRLVIALRDPRDVVLSCFLRYLPLNAISVCFLSPEATAQRYALDMTAWLKYRDIIPGRWCEVRYEDTVANIEKQARQALQTLGLAWDDSVLAYRDRLAKESRRKQVTSPTYEAVTEPVYTRAIGRWKHYEEHLEPAIETLEPFIQKFGYT